MNANELSQYPKEVGLVLVTKLAAPGHQVQSQYPKEVGLVLDNFKL